MATETPHSTHDISIKKTHSIAVVIYSQKHTNTLSLSPLYLKSKGES